MHFPFWEESIIKIYKLQRTWCWLLATKSTQHSQQKKKKTATKTIWAAVQSRNSSPLSVYLHWRSFYGIFQAFSSSTWAYKVRFSVISAAPAGFMHQIHRSLSHCCAPSVKTVAELTFTWKCHGLLSQTWRLRRTHDENIEGGDTRWFMRLQPWVNTQLSTYQWRSRGPTLFSLGGGLFAWRHREIFQNHDWNWPIELLWV